jgi:hypothetical protein
MLPPGRVLGHQTLVDNGPRAQRWDLVLLGDGYTAAELPKYRSDAQAIVDHILATPPFNELLPAINVHRVDVASDESGAGDRCTGVRRATFFTSEFCAFNIPRLLVADPLRAIDVATDAIPEMNATLLMVNTDTYGGSGGAVPVFSLAASAFEIALHEMGHSFFGLADEYSYLSGCSEADHDRAPAGEPVEPNVTSRLNPIEWQALVTAPVPTMANPDCTRCDDRASTAAPGAVGAFEGAKYFKCGLYRPEFNCRMRELGHPFCAVCRNTIHRVLEPFKPKPKNRRRAVHT